MVSPVNGLMELVFRDGEEWIVSRSFTGADL